MGGDFPQWSVPDSLAGKPLSYSKCSDQYDPEWKTHQPLDFLSISRSIGAPKATPLHPQLYLWAASSEKDAPPLPLTFMRGIQ